MKKLIIIFIFIPVLLNAQSIPDPSGVSEKALKSIEDIAASIISDSFNPLAHYKAEEKIFYAVPVWFSVDKAMDKPEITGENLGGLAFGAGAAYAFTDKIMSYAIVTGMKLSGSLEMPVYGSTYGSLKNSIDYSLFSILAGGGYDLYRNDVVSVPVYLGLNLQHFSAELVPQSFEQTPNTVNSSMKGDGVLYGFSGGLAVSFKFFNIFRITPYYLFIRNFNSTKIEGETTISTLLYGNKYSFEVDPVSAGMTGFNFGFETEQGFSFSISAGSMISSFIGFGSRASENGVDMKSAAIVFSYRN
jgi:hypothetical protein